MFVQKYERYLRLFILDNKQMIIRDLITFGSAYVEFSPRSLKRLNPEDVRFREGMRLTWYKRLMKYIKKSWTKKQ